MTSKLTQRLLAFGPPPEVAGVGENDAGRSVVGRGRLLLFECFDHVHHRALVEAALSASYTVGQNTKVLAGLAEDDHDARLGGDVLAETDLDVALIFAGNAEREEDLLQAFGFET